MKKLLTGAVAAVLALLAAAPAHGDMASLKAACSPALTPADAPVLRYRFCDDGLPPTGGRTPNVGAIRALPVPAFYRGAVPEGSEDPTVIGLPPKSPVPGEAAGVPGADPTGDVALDVDITMPNPATTPPPPGGYPLIILMHGCCSGSKTSWESSVGRIADSGSNGEKWHYNNVWFASRGYVVITYTARGFVNGDGPDRGRGSTGETQIDSLQYEMNDMQHLACQVSGDPAFSVNPQKVIASGGSYGGGFSWLALVDPIWTCPAALGGQQMRLAAAAPRYGWTDLPYSLLPTGRHRSDDGALPAFDGRDSGTLLPGAPGPRPFLGIPIRTIIQGLFLAGQTGFPSRPPDNPHATFPQSVQIAYNCTQTAYPSELNPACGELINNVAPDFLRYRSAYYWAPFFSRLASNPAYRIPVFSAGTFTDPLFPPTEHRRMASRLKGTSQGYPIQEYYGDYQHFVQNKAKEWADTCGGDRHLCQVGEYPSGDLNAAPAGLQRTGITTRLNRFLDFFVRPPANPNPPAPAADVTASLQVCSNKPDGAAPDEPGETFTAATFDGLAPGALRLDLQGAQSTQNLVSDPHAVRADPVFNSVPQNNNSRCVIETTPAGPGVATYESAPLPAQATLLGGTDLAVTYSATGATNGLQLNARLYDVFPDGSAVLMQRVPRRIDPGRGDRSPLLFQLRATGWRFKPGHRIRVELTGDDDPSFLRSSTPFQIAISRVQLGMFVREQTFGVRPPSGLSPAFGVGGPDRFAPAARMLAPRLASDVSNSARFRIAWRGSDFGSGLRSFRVEVRTLSGVPRARRAERNWRPIRGLTSTGRTSAMFSGRTGATYEFRVRATDRVGNTSRYASGVTIVPTGDQPAGSRCFGPWWIGRNRSAFGSSFKHCSSPRCSMTLTYRGGSFFLLGRTGPSGGRARVTFDGRSRTIDFYSRRTGYRRVLFSARRSGIRRHVVRVKVLGTRRRASRGSLVALDGFGLGSRR